MRKRVEGRQGDIHSERGREKVRGKLQFVKKTAREREKWKISKEIKDLKPFWSCPL